MPISDCDVRDPRMKRTRQMLQGALKTLLRKKSLDEILVQDITDEATVNRATFYDHYTDKYALFEAMVGTEFQRLLNERNVWSDGTCGSGLAAIILAVCDYLAQVYTTQSRHAFTPLMDAAVTATIRHTVMQGVSRNALTFNVPPKIAATSVSWAIYGAAKEWFDTRERPSAEEIVPSLVRMIHPLLEGTGAIAAETRTPAHPQKTTARAHKEKEKKITPGSQA